MSQETTMKELITNVKNLINDNNGTSKTINTIQTLQRGVFGGVLIYPAISILPINQVFPERFSNGVFKTYNTISLEIYCKANAPTEAHAQSMLIIDQIKDVLYTSNNWKFSDTVYNLIFGGSTFNEVSDFPQTGLYNTSLQLQFHSMEEEPVEIIEKTIAEESARSMVDRITDTFKTYADITHANNAVIDLSNIQTFNEMNIPSVNGFLAKARNYPVIIITEDNEDRGHLEAGRDIMERNFRAVIYTKALPKWTNLAQNLDIVEQVKDIISINRQWATYAYNTQLRGVSYNLTQLERTFLYSSEVLFTVFTKEAL